MATNIEFAEYVCDQIRGAGEITVRKMFGEYGVYLNGKYIACICDNQFFVKPTETGRRVLGTPNEQPPYEGYDGAKLYYLIEDLDGKDLLQKLLRATWEELLLPKPKKPKK